MLNFADSITSLTCLLVDFAQSKIWNSMCEILKDIRIRGSVGKQRGLHMIAVAFCKVICQQTFDRHIDFLAALQQIKHARAQVRFQPAVSAFTT